LKKDALPSLYELRTINETVRDLGHLKKSKYDSIDYRKYSKKSVNNRFSSLSIKHYGDKIVLKEKKYFEIKK
jgi:hypothetical protein